MNKIILMGRLTRDPEIRYSQGSNPMAVARYTLAVDKKKKRDDGITADFFCIVAFDRLAEFAESKGAGGSNDRNGRNSMDSDGFMDIPDDMEELPFY